MFDFPYFAAGFHREAVQLCAVQVPQAVRGAAHDGGRGPGQAGGDVQAIQKLSETYLVRLTETAQKCFEDGIGVAQDWPEKCSSIEQVTLLVLLWLTHRAHKPACSVASKHQVTLMQCNVAFCKPGNISWKNGLVKLLLPSPKACIYTFSSTEKSFHQYHQALFCTFF